MDRLWAPWRLSFIEGKPGDKAVAAGATGCIFCDYPRPQNATPGPGDDEHDRMRLVVTTRPQAFVIMNRYPYSNGHLMVVPRRHVSELEALDARENQELHGLLAESVAAIRRAYRPDGVNVGMNMGRAAGAGIADHIHWHVVPRWSGDNNFMPVFSDTRVISEGLLESYARVRAALAG